MARLWRVILTEDAGLTAVSCAAEGRTYHDPVRTMMAGKWATGAIGQKPCAVIDIATVDFKGFFDPFQRVTKNYSFGSVRNYPTGRSKFPLKNAVLSKWPIFSRIVAIPHIEVPERFFGLLDDTGSRIPELSSCHFGQIPVSNVAAEHRNIAQNTCNSPRV
jgi:hypothetical protein